MSGRYVVDENGEHVAVLLDVEEYEQLVAQHHAPAEHDESIGDKPLDGEDFDPEEGERRITKSITPPTSFLVLPSQTSSPS